MNFKILCSDLDGTLLSTKSDVSSFTIQEIERLRHQLRIILVSARMPSGMFYLQENLSITHEPIICYNGALILANNNVLHSTTIPATLVKEIQELCKLRNTTLGIYSYDNWYVPNMSIRVEKEIKHTKVYPTIAPTKNTLVTIKDNGAHKIMLMSNPLDVDVLMETLTKKYSALVHSYRSNDTLIEISPKEVSKITAIKLLLQQDESLVDVIAFGDNYNDIEMISNAGTGVAVGNARAELMEVANFVCAPNTDDGVAHFIKEHL